MRHMLETQRHRDTEAQRKRANKKLCFARFLCASVSLCLCVSYATSAGLNLIDTVKTGNVQAVRTLIRDRANVNGQEPDGMTALHWAVRRDDFETAQLLIRAG